MWEDFASAISNCAEGCYVKVQGQISKYQGKFQITLTKMRLRRRRPRSTPPTSSPPPGSTSPKCGPSSAATSTPSRTPTSAASSSPSSTIDDIGAAYREAPAAKVLHHAWIGGLLEHVLTLVRVCRAAAPFYPEVDPDLLVTGAILHDIGKVRELAGAQPSATPSKAR